jgi:hypothetical protein
MRAREPEALDAHDASHALGPDAGVQRRDVAAHAVADQRDWLARREMVEQRLEVGEIVRKPVALGRPLAATEPAPVRRDERPLGRPRIYQELERVAGIHPAVQQEHGLGIAARPARHVMAQAADVEIERLGRATR